MLDQIPQELRNLKQWVSAGPNKFPLNSKNGSKASVTDPSTWGTFEEARQAGFKHIGFVFTENDPYAVIDLDDPYSKVNKDGSPRYTPEECEVIIARQNKIREYCETYTEISQSGKGYHLLCKGKIPQGRNKDEIEVYSESRYMICTGNICNNLPITDQQEIIDILYNEMSHVATASLVQVDGTVSDTDLVEMASNAINAEKFNKLCNGDWENDYESQSEADFALLSIFAYYTQDNDQVRSLFRMSKMGKREKAVRNDKYLNFALEKIRAKQPPPVDMDSLKLPTLDLSIKSDTSDNGNDQNPIAKPPAKSKTGIPTPPIKKPPIARPPVKYDYPSGLVGEIAKYIYSSAIRPVHEIALTAAISLAAGVCGRSFNISGTGLNQYLILLAKTGTGKESAATGIDNLIAATRPIIPMIDEFVGPSAFASGQALVRVLDNKPVFLSILGEFGLTLQQLCSHNASSSEIMLRKVLLDLYAKSGWNKMLRPSVYSDTEKNTNLVQAPNVTIFGESTPETFYRGLDQSHIAEGLIPRFCIIEYKGNRPPRNPNAFHVPEDKLVKDFAEFASVAINTNNNNTCCPVQTSAKALKLFDTFDRFADGEINKHIGEIEPQLWNRAHLKALKLAALIAVGEDPHQAIISESTAKWSIKFIRKDIEGVLSRFSNGEVGLGDHRFEQDIRRVVETYWGLTDSQKLNYKAPKALLNHKIIPYSYLRDRLRLLSNFKNDRRGATKLVEESIEDLIKAEVLNEIPAIQVKAEFNLRQKLYTLGSAW